MQWLRTRSRLLGAVVAIGIGTTIGTVGGSDAVSGPALSLLRIDTELGVAIVRLPAGEVRAWRVGGTSPDGAYRLHRILNDRIEIVAIGPRGADARYWLQVGASGAIVVTPNAPDAPVQTVTEVVGRSPGGSTR